MKSALIFRTLFTLTVLIVIASVGATYGPGERCRGAPGYPNVPWHNPPCPGGAACDVPDREYGFRCPETYGRRADCYKTGERAQGAPGKPAVEWRPCCDQNDKQVEKDSPGAWGKFCLPSEGSTPSDIDSLDSPDSEPCVEEEETEDLDSLGAEPSDEEEETVEPSYEEEETVDSPGAEPSEEEETEDEDVLGAEPSDEEEDIGSIESILAPGVKPSVLGEHSNVSVVGCSESAVLLTSSVDIGKLLIHIDRVANGTASAFDCLLDGCDVLFRFAVSQEPANILGNSRCPDGAECFLVQTKRASMSDMLGPDVLLDTETGQLGTDLLLEDVFACDTLPKDSTSVRHGIPMSSKQESRETPTSFFDQCFDLGEWMWRKSSFIGGCPFSTECDDKPDKACYHCTQEPGSSCNNGCGGAGGPTFTSFPLIFDFANGCCGHDYCYDSQAFTQQECDAAMFDANMRTCYAGSFASLPSCTLAAVAFRTILWFGGKSFYADSARLQKAHLETCKESPSPVPTVPNEDTVEAGMFTDPHLRTFDQLAFDCQASGEFILARSASNDFMLQGRFSGPDSAGSVLTGIALRDDRSPRVQVSVSGNAPSDPTDTCELQLVVDGDLQTFESASFGANGTTSLRVQFSAVTITTARGVSVTFSRRLSRTFGCYLESFSVSVPVSDAPGISGLLGTPNGDRSDDWQSQDGTVVPLPETRRDRVFQTAYTYCTTNWCIRDARSSLFSYFDGQSHADFDLCDRPYAEPDLSSASDELLALCGEDTECLIDGVVGDVDDAIAGRDALVQLESRLNLTSEPVEAPDFGILGVDGNLTLPFESFTFLGDEFAVSVVACSESAVLLTGSIPIGNLLYNLGWVSNFSATDDDCRLNYGCGFLFRFAVSQERADVLGGVTCPDGVECALVQTDKASFGDMYRPEFLAAFGLGADTVVDEWYRSVLCGEGFDDATSVRQSVGAVASSIASPSLRRQLAKALTLA